MIVLLRIFVLVCCLLTAVPCVAGFVTIQGDQFAVNGQIYKLKGTNYYPRGYMWAAMWNSWSWQTMLFESEMIRDTGGGKPMNCVRILVPYSNGGWNGPNVPTNRLIKLENLVNMLGSKGIRSNITLFDWETTFPAAGTATEANHIAHLDKIVNRLKNNPYVFMWDVKNEPDHPENINGKDNWDDAPTQKAKIISWLQRMVAAIKARDPNHPVSVGLRWADNYSDINSFCDVAVFHSYWPNIGTQQIPNVKAAMGSNQKPIVVQEFGYPSYPPINDFSETSMLNMYKIHMPAFIQHNIAGCLQWTTFDEKTYTNPTEPDKWCFGLWTYEYRLKPAGEYYRDTFQVALFPPEPDTAAPDPVTNLTATALESTVILNWRNPENWDFTGTVIRMKTTGFPTSHTDGTLVCNRLAAPDSSDSFTISGLTNGQTYYFAAFSYDGVPLYCATAATATATPQVATGGITCGEARLLPNNTVVDLNRKVVSAVIASESCLYIQEPDRSAGIRVAVNPAGFSVGDQVNVRGTLTTRVMNGNSADRQLQSVTIAKIGTAAPPEPYTLVGPSFGGGPVGTLFKGVKGSSGLNNIGLLVRITGTVTHIASPYIYVDDGHGFPNLYGASTVVKGVMVKCLSVTGFNVGDAVTATGVIAGSIPINWTENRAFLLARTEGDVVKQ